MEEKKDQRVTIMMSESELESVDRWAHDNRIKSRGEAIRQLLFAAQELLPALEKVRNDFVHQKQDIESYQRNVHQILMAYASVEFRLYGEQDSEEQRLHRAFDEIHSFDNGDVEALLDIMDFAVEHNVGAELSDREMFIIERVDEGHDDEAIANIMGVSERTMQSYIKMLCAKTGATEREKLADYLTVSLSAPGDMLAATPHKMDRPSQFYFGHRPRKLKL